MNPSILNIFGLCFDLIGAILISIEVVSRFKGEKYINNEIGCGDTLAPIPTKDFIRSEQVRFKLMSIGIVLLLIGFSVQIYANYIQFQMSNMTAVNKGNELNPINSINHTSVFIPNAEKSPFKSENRKTKHKKTTIGK